MMDFGAKSFWLRSKKLFFFPLKAFDGGQALRSKQKGSVRVCSDRRAGRRRLFLKPTCAPVVAMNNDQGVLAVHYWLVIATFAPFRRAPSPMLLYCLMITLSIIFRVSLSGIIFLTLIFLLL